MLLLAVAVVVVAASFWQQLVYVVLAIGGINIQVLCSPHVCIFLH